jgi:cellulose synthase/poly-beta-1,6-N-acetylglucosamine synthase-like glycosyltransferase
MDLFLLVGSSPYFCFVVIIISGLLFRQKQTNDLSSDTPFVSVVIAARNEENNIANLLDDLIKQNINKNNFEIIVSNDRSEDQTKKIIDHYAEKNSFIKTIHITKKNDMASKKYALEKAIANSKGEIILATDADCRVPKNWAASMAKLVVTENKVVIGYSKIESENKLINEIQKIDFLGIMAANGGLLTTGIVCSGSGQNLGYKKEDFYKVGGFEPVKDKESGDDMYIVQAISKIKGAVFNYDENSFVSTLPKKTLLGYINQRIRWSSNSRFTMFTSPLFFCFLTSAFLVNLNILLAIIFLLDISIILLFIKFFLEALVLYIGGKLFLTRISVTSYFIWNLTQPFYIPIVAIGGLIGKFKWKQ